MRVFRDATEVQAAVGSDLGTSDWVTVDQSRIDRFAGATGDHQWIHVDVERARTGPYGSTIAHGYLTLSMLPWLGSQIFRWETSAARVNYGLNKVRFPAAVPAGTRVRASAKIASVIEASRGHLITFAYTVEIEGSDRPACLAEMLVLLLSD
jgi:acyl dehydratase